MSADLLRRAAAYLTQSDPSGEISPFELDETGVAALAALIEAHIPLFDGLGGPIEHEVIALARAILPAGEQ